MKNVLLIMLKLTTILMMFLVKKILSGMLGGVLILHGDLDLWVGAATDILITRSISMAPIVGFYGPLKGTFNRCHELILI